MGEAALKGQRLLDVTDLKTYIFSRSGVGKAVDGVSLHVDRGETLGLVGESGSGKSLTALSVIGLHPQPAARVVGGKVLFRGEDLLRMTAKELRRVRGSEIAIVLQDPNTALNPVFNVQNQLFESLRLHLDRDACRSRAIEMLDLMRIGAPERRLRSYPHQLSGGMQQRVVGAIAFSCQPELLIADEPTTALDSIGQAAYLALLKEIQDLSGFAILFITHDFGVVAKMCDRVAVLYAGKIVETAPTRSVLERPAHPYTTSLLGSVPNVLRKREQLQAIEGQPPSIFDLPEGCRFRPRCPLYARLGSPEVCRTDLPDPVTVEPGHLAACHFAGEGGASQAATAIASD